MRPEAQGHCDRDTLNSGIYDDSSTGSPKVSPSRSCCPRWRVKQDCGRGEGLAHWATGFVFAGDACWATNTSAILFIQGFLRQSVEHYKGNWRPFEKNTSWAAAAIINTCSPGRLSVCLRLQPLRVWGRK